MLSVLAGLTSMCASLSHVWGRDRHRLAYIVALTLVFVWSMPGTIGLRYGLLLISLWLVWPGVDLRALLKREALARTPLLLLILLSAWFILQALFISSETAWAFRELRGQWLMAGVALLIGVGLQNLSLRAPSHTLYPSRLWTGIVLLFALQTSLEIGFSLGLGGASGAADRMLTFTGGKLETSFLLNLMLAILTVDLFVSFVYRYRFLCVPLTVSAFLLILGFGLNYLAGARNGVLGALFLSMGVLCLLCIEGRKHLGGLNTVGIVMVVLLGVGGFAYSSYRADARWERFIETAAIAIDIDHSSAWYNDQRYPYPKLSNGERVDISAYQRISWLTAGSRLLTQVPWGVGYGRNAFARALKQQGYDTKIGHAHSGFVDLLAGGGIPAVLIWLLFLGALIFRGMRWFFKTRDPTALLMVFLVSGFGGRMLIESVARDHMLQIFFFLLGVMLTTQTVRTEPPRT